MKWLVEDKVCDVVEEEEDVIKRGVGAMISFYFNFMYRNLVMGGDVVRDMWWVVFEFDVMKLLNVMMVFKFMSVVDCDCEFIARAAETSAIFSISFDVTLVERLMKVVGVIVVEMLLLVKVDLNVRRNIEVDVSDVWVRYFEWKCKVAGGA